MSRGLLFSFIFHAFVIFMTALTLPFMLREAIDLPPIVSVDFIQITDKTNIPFAPKAREILEKVKEDKKREAVAGHDGTVDVTCHRGDHCEGGTREAPWHLRWDGEFSSSVASTQCTEGDTGASWTKIGMSTSPGRMTASAPLLDSSSWMHTHGSFKSSKRSSQIR